ncbi:MAG TPA: putative maltokinase [Terriglobales bacterium]|jgi:trehalose synthase-fused probable maltokinase|nr:putative maltokinase [Terriglobales bacterium]
MADTAARDESMVAALHHALPQILPEFLITRRWFGGKARVIESVEIADVVPIGAWYLVLARIKYASGPPEMYHIPLGTVPHSFDTGLDQDSMMRFRGEKSADEYLLADAMLDEEFLGCLLDTIIRGARFPGTLGVLQAVSTSALGALLESSKESLSPSVMNAEQSNSSVVYGRHLVLKIFRRVEAGLNPDLEIGSFLTRKASFRNVPAVAGSLEYVSQQGTSTSLAVLQAYVPNQGDAWQFTLNALREYYARAQKAGFAPDEIPQAPILELAGEPVPDEVGQRIGPYLDSARLLGRRTAELHLALASEKYEPAFTPVPFSPDERQAFVSSALRLLKSNFDLLRHHKNAMQEFIRQDVQRVLGHEEKARRRLGHLAEHNISAMVTRIHGDYHLGQVLFTGSDFVIIDFEGEPARPLEERRKKRSPLQDVAGMLRSFHYAAYAPLLQSSSASGTADQNLQVLAGAASYWQRWVSATFLKTYLEVARGAQFIPESKEELVILLDAFLLDKAVYELGYELNNRPSWVRIPLDGITQLLER